VKGSLGWHRPLLVGLWLLFLYACVGTAWSASARDAGVLVIGLGRDFYEGPESETYLHGSTNVWEALVALDEKLNPKGWLAETWEASDGGKTWKFQIRKDVFFHNGSPLKASDVVANIKRRKDNPKLDARGDLHNVLSAEATGEHEVTFHLERPLPHFPALLSYYGSPIFHPSVFGEHGKITGMIATGPFRLERISIGESVELSAFDRYWGRKPAFSRIMFKDIPDAQTRVFSLIKGDIDAIVDLGAILPSQIRELSECKDIVIKKSKLATTHYLFFNCGRAPFSERSARLWLIQNLDRDQFVPRLTEGTGQIAQAFYSPLAERWFFPGTFAAVGATLPRPALDRELTLLLHSGVLQRLPYVPMAQVILDLLRRHGISARIELREAGGYQEALKAGAFDLSIQPRNLQTGDPDFFYAFNLAAATYRNMGYLNPAMAELIQAARYEMNEDKRHEFYHRLAVILGEDMPMLPLYHEEAVYAHRNTIEGLEMDAIFRPELLNVRPTGK
jgi:peptide/nickel transport system substrate-binding protein